MLLRLIRSLGWCAVFVLLAALSAAAADAPLSGTIDFTPGESEATVPERFRLEAARFAWQAVPVGADSKTVEVFDVTFPSPVVTPHKNNNTVHAEYYRPKREGKRPAVLVLHILGGDFPLSRLFCNRLAQQGVAALFVKMPFYGPRRQPDSSRRMVSANPDETVEGMTQAILDIRRSVAWLAARDEIDADQIGVFGISLGGITGALAAGVEPRIQNVCLLLAGGDIGRVALDSPEVQKVRGGKPFAPGEREAMQAALAQIDPITYATGARGKRILLLNAASDEVIPKECTLSLWKSFGEPQIVWYSGGHYTVIRHVFRALERVAHFFAAVDGASVPQTVARAASPPAIDGRLDDACWREARTIRVDRPLGRSGVRTDPPPMVARLAWDEHYLYVGYEVHDDGSPSLLVAPGGLDKPFWDIDHTAGNELSCAACRVPPRSQWTARGMPQPQDVVRDRERKIEGGGEQTLAHAVQAFPPAGGSAASGAPQPAGFSGEIRLPWISLGLAKELRNKDGSYDLANLALPILAVHTPPEASKSAPHSSGELPKQPYPFSADRWPVYRLGERQ